MLIVPSGAFTLIGTPERSHPAGQDETIFSTKSAPTATSVGPSTAMTLAWVAALGVIGAVRSWHCAASSCGAFGGDPAGDPAEYQAPCKTMLGESALRLT